MHGCGNDYLLIDEPVEMSPALVRTLCDRRTGVGADGVITIREGDDDACDVAMRIYNADGGDGGVCGNGARCVAERAAALGWCDERVRIDVGGRTLEAERLGAGAVSVDMGGPVLALPDIPVVAKELDERGALGVEHQVEGLPAIFVSMGNPHLVAMVEEDPAGFNLGVIGPRIENHRAFPEGMNLHIALVTARDSVSVRTWERGAGLTSACGTGACAVVVAGVLSGRLDRFATVRMPGGNLDVEWDDAAERVILSGPTSVVYAGEWAGTAQNREAGAS